MLLTNVSKNKLLKSPFLFALIHVSVFLVSRMPGIPLFYEWVPFYCGVVGFQTLARILFTLLDCGCFPQVCTMANMQADVGDKLIHAYVRLPFDMIPTSTTITYTNKYINKLIHTYIHT